MRPYILLAAVAVAGLTGVARALCGLLGGLQPAGFAAIALAPAAGRIAAGLSSGRFRRVLDHVVEVGLNEPPISET